MEEGGRCSVCQVKITEASLELHEKNNKKHQLRLLVQQHKIKQERERETAREEERKRKEEEDKILHLHNLPEEIFIPIFGYLSLHDLLSLSLVNTEWHRILSDDYLWK